MCLAAVRAPEARTVLYGVCTWVVHKDRKEDEYHGVVVNISRRRGLSKQNAATHFHPIHLPCSKCGYFCSSE